MVNKKALERDITLYIVLAIITLALIIGLIIKLDLIHKFDIILPSFGNRTAIEDKDNMLNQIFMDDGSGRCKPVKGLYSLNKGELEVWYENSWHNVDGEVADYQKYFKYLMRENLSLLENEGIKLNFEGEHIIRLHELGLASEIEDSNYVYAIDGSDKFLIEIKIDENNAVLSKVLFPDLMNINNFSDEERQRFELMFNSFKESLETSRLSFAGVLYPVDLYKKGDLVCLFFNLEGVDYGIGLDKNLYYFDSKIGEWILVENIATYKEIVLKEEKDKLEAICNG